MGRHAGGVAAAGGWALLAGMLMAIPGCGEDVAPAPPDGGQYGSLQNAEEFAVAAQALPVEALRDPPTTIALPAAKTLTNTPAVAAQGTAKTLGSPGTCEAQSFGRGLGSYTAARNPDYSIRWDAAQPGNTMSAAYQFALAVNQGNATCPAGGKATPYLSRLAGFGSPTEADVPYQPDCGYFATIDLAKSYPDVGRLRIGSFATFRMSTTDPAATLALIKGYLANEQAVAFSGPVFKGYDAPALSSGVFYDVPANLVPNSGHGQLLIGYDENAGMAAKKGALLVQNSFGTDWPGASKGSLAPPGKMYWSYDTFTASQKFFAVAYPYDPAPPTGALFTPTSAAAPAASIERAYQWAPGDGSAYLIFVHHFADPVRITSVAVSEPAPGTETATGQYGQFISKGYTYLKRSDGKAFLPGVYRVRIEAVLRDGISAAYTGSVTVGTALPANPPAATMKSAAGKLVDSIGASVAVAVNP